MFTLWLRVVKTKTSAMENECSCLLKATFHINEPKYISFGDSVDTLSKLFPRKHEGNRITMCITEMYIMVYKSFKCCVSL